jgi:hypothetical protein
MHPYVIACVVCPPYHDLLLKVMPFLDRTITDLVLVIVLSKNGIMRHCIMMQLWLKRNFRSKLYKTRK